MEETIKTEIPDFLSELQNNIKKDDNKLKAEDIIEEEFVIDENNLRDLYVMGKGGFGEVKVVYDTRNLKRYAKKTFVDYKDYKDEKDRMRQIEQIFDEDFEDIACTLAKYDNEKMTLYYHLGICSLQEFMSQRSEQKIFWWQNQQELCYILKQSYEFFNILFEKNLYHTDMKPANIVLVPQTGAAVQKVFEIRFIDFGACVEDYNQLIAYTQLYFIPDINEKAKEKGHFFANKQERIKAELYTLARTMIRIMLDSVWVKEERNPSDKVYFENTEEGNQLALKKLYAYYSKDLVNVIEQMIEQKDPEEYQQELEELTSCEIIEGTSLGGLQIEQTEKDVEELFRNSLYERALKVVDALEDKVWKSLKLVFYKEILLEKIAYHDRMNQLMREIDNRKDEFAPEYLDSPDLNKKKMYFNAVREAIWHIGTIKRRILIDEMIEQCTQIFGRESDMVALCYYQRAKIEMSAQIYPDALKFFDQCFEIYDKIEKNYQNQQDLAFALKYCGNVYIYTKKYDKAFEHFQKEGEIWKSIAGDKHGEYGGALQNQSICKYYLQNYEEGYQQLKKAITIFLNSFGDKNQYYSAALSWMVVFCKQLKKYEEGGNYSLQASLLFLDTVGSSHSHYRNNISNLCENYHVFQKNLIGKIQSELLENYEKCFKLEKYEQAEKYLTIAYDCIKNCISYEYIKAEEQAIVKIKEKIAQKKKIINIKKKQKNILNKQETIKQFDALLEFITDPNEKAVEIMKQAKLLSQVEARTLIKDFLTTYSQEKAFYNDLLMEQCQLEISLGILEDAEKNLNYIKDNSVSTMQKDLANTNLMNLYEVMKRKIPISPIFKVELYNIYEKQINLLKVQLGQTSQRFRHIVQNTAVALENIEMFFQSEKLIKDLIENSKPIKAELESYQEILKRLHEKKKYQLKQKIQQQKVQQQGWKKLDRFCFFYDLYMNEQQQQPQVLKKYQNAKINVLDFKKTGLTELFQIFMFNQQSSGYILIKNFTPENSIYLCNKLYQMCLWFFSRPEEQKLQYAKKHINPENHHTYRGYEKYSDSFEEINIGYFNDIIKNTERKEIKITNLYEDLQWPKFSSSFRKAIEEQHKTFDSLNLILLKILAELNNQIDQQTLINLFKNPINLQSYINCSTLYLRKFQTGNSFKSKDDDEKVFMNENYPQGFLSYQVLNHQHGLQIKQDGQWKNVPPLGNSILVSLGGLFTAITESKPAVPYRIVDCGQDFYQSGYVSEFDAQQAIPLGEPKWNIGQFNNKVDEKKEEDIQQETIKVDENTEEQRLQGKVQLQENTSKTQTTQDLITLLNQLKVKQSKISAEQEIKNQQEKQRKQLLELQNKEGPIELLNKNRPPNLFYTNDKTVTYGQFKSVQLQSKPEFEKVNFETSIVSTAQRPYTPENNNRPTIDFEARRKIQDQKLSQASKQI
ncbi:Protein kinase-like domain [Pseudocohnilembus persalinus]|uniref:Protein kinase-like domain n=1 Tax=Pseudocohnilembus persalinus TaxID=266149 RepID=A0A0V0QV97_PSEPJ|nr:Protein kinase-like domain [Pseudocohnilembus persalinus]|eukprot:KRX06297.1 Protein kinase-like domain [Pseudocohnilembus persalinus]